MGAPKPCLGYRSRTDAVLALRKEGLSTQQIAERIGIAVKDVSSLEASAKRYPVARNQPRPATSVLLPPWLMDALKPHADRRRVKPGFLAFRIVETVVTEGLIDSVLDDLSEDAAA